MLFGHQYSRRLASLLVLLAYGISQVPAVVAYGGSPVLQGAEDKQRCYVVGWVLDLDHDRQMASYLDGFARENDLCLDHKAIDPDGNLVDLWSEDLDRCENDPVRSGRYLTHHMLTGKVDVDLMRVGEVAAYREAGLERAAHPWLSADVSLVCRPGLSCNPADARKIRLAGTRNIPWQARILALHGSDTVIEGRNDVARQLQSGAVDAVVMLDVHAVSLIADAGIDFPRAPLTRVYGRAWLGQKTDDDKQAILDTLYRAGRTGRQFREAILLSIETSERTACKLD